MKILTLLILFLLLSGCAQTPLAELEEQSFACGLEKSPTCDLINEELEERYKFIERVNKRRNKKECSPGAKCYYNVS